MQNSVQAPLLVLLGPTASGKTALSLKLAEHFAGEIVSCDSVAVYREMEIGTAKPTLEERERIPHHMIDVTSLSDPFTAGEYACQARAAIAEITSKGKLPIVTGGTGLYLRALIDGLFPAPPRCEELRERLWCAGASRGQGWLHRILSRLDPAAADIIHPHDTPKLIRAIEVCLANRIPMTESWRIGRQALQGYRVLRIGTNPDRKALYDRINLRAAAMFREGLVEETRRLSMKYGEAAHPLTSLGYRQAMSVITGDLSLPEAVGLAQQGHRNYAKRQMTWFRRERGVHWIDGFGSQEEVLHHAIQIINDHLGAVAAPQPELVSRMAPGAESVS